MGKQRERWVYKTVISLSRATLAPFAHGCIAQKRKYGCYLLVYTLLVPLERLYFAGY